MSETWKKCAVCKSEIKLGMTYQECSVSTCRKNAYCSVDCWEVHVPVLNHKSAFAEEAKAPSKIEAVEPLGKTSGKRIIVKQTAKPSTHETNATKDILIVASKLKNYVKIKHDINTSANVMGKLSELVRHMVDDAVLKARQDGRKTLMDKDF